MEIARLGSVMGMLGGLLAVAGIILTSLLPPGKLWLVTAIELVALLCFVLFFVLHFRTLKALSKRRSTRLGINSVLMAVLFMGILGIINFLGTRHFQRWDLSETQSFSLAPQTHSVLRNLKQPVTITVFSQDGSPGSNTFRDLLESYRSGSERIQVNFVDPERRPDEARRYGITKLNTAVLESGSENIRITTPSEAELTSALIRVTRENKKKILFLEGHGERSLSSRERDGLELVKDALVKQGYDIGTLSLLQESAVPAQAAALVVAGPQRRVTAEEKTRLKTYVNAGGRLFLMLDPDTRPDLEDLLSGWGLSAGPGVLVDLQDRLAMGDLTALLVRTFTEHEISQDLSSAVLMPTSQHLTFKDDASGLWDFVPLARTSARSWAETDLQGQGKVVSYTTGKDIQGPLPLAGILTPKKAPEEGKPRPAVVLVGNSSFASNAYANFPGNTDLFLHIISWLAQERDLVSITPKEPAFRPFIPNATQATALFWLQVVLLPATTLIYGLSVWRRRRRL